MPIHIPTIARQREIVAEYETLTNRIRLNEQIIHRLDWDKKADIKAQLKVQIILTLAKHKYPPATRDDVFKAIFEQAENFKKNRQDNSNEAVSNLHSNVIPFIVEEEDRLPMAAEDM